jgi:hypothetical protein
MQKVFFSLLAVIFLWACNNNAGDASTADSLNRTAPVDTAGRMDTTSYERNNVIDADSTK